MPETLVDLLMTRPPTAERPLLGVMILLVEDSRLSCEALKLICHRSGARIRRAESLASAERHLRAYRPRAIIADLGLPDGSGLSLIEQVARAEPRIDAIVAMSGDDSLAAAAMEAGADIFLPKPLQSVSAFQSTLLGLLPDGCRPSRVARPADDTVSPDPIALRDDLALAAELLSAPADEETLRYVAGFLRSLGREARDRRLSGMASELEAVDPGNDGGARLRAVAAGVRARMSEIDTV